MLHVEFICFGFSFFFFVGLLLLFLFVCLFVCLFDFCFSFYLFTFFALRFPTFYYSLSESLFRQKTTFGLILRTFTPFDCGSFELDLKIPGLWFIQD